MNNFKRKRGNEPGRVFIGILLFPLFLFSCKTEKEKIKPTVSSLSESVYASVTVQPKDKYYAYASIAGIIKKVLVQEGDDVKSGQPLLEVENDNPKLNAENARLAYNLAKSNFSGGQSQLQELVSQIKLARLKLANDSINLLRQKNLWANKIGTKVELDQRQLAFQAAKNEISILNNRYNQLSRQLETQVKQAQNNYQSSLNVSKDFTVVSQIDGRVFEVKKKMGEIVLQQEPLAMLGRRDSFLIEMLVDEVDIARLKTGQKVIVRLDSYGKSVFDAVVSKIYPSMDIRTQTFKVEARFIAMPDVLYPGLTGEANIVIAEKQNVISIPNDYLIEGKRVMTKDGETPVKTGLKNFERVEIISGIDTGKFIYKPK